MNKLPHCIDCGKVISGFEHKRCKKCVIKFCVGINASNYKGVKYNCLDCGKKLANIYAKRCQSCAKTGKRNSHYGKPATHTKRILYNKIIFRSCWEANFAKWCDCSNIKWLYESKTFDLGNLTYTPDFYLPEFDCYIEVKGFWQGLAKKKFNKFKKLYKIFLFNKLKLKNYSIINRSS